nr:Acetyl-coenzyme A carboxylase carboxyl transferase subunit beta [Candidatus Pantoea persica]
MSYRHFALFNVAGALAWVLLFAYAGYLFGDLPVVQGNLKLLIVGIIDQIFIHSPEWLWFNERHFMSAEAIFSGK